MSAVAYAAPQTGFAPAPRPQLVPAPPALVPPAYRRKRRALGDPTPLACTVARTALEVALGADGIDTLTRWITPTLRTSLLKQRSLARRAGYVARGDVSVARIRMCRVSATAVEAGIVLMEGDVAHPIAMRLEVSAGRWLTTVLEVG
ncbi:Rv3235 family protein [Demequina sp. TTPB684]|uniref:Rv3235 family protein n=1 Tax=unclassified Demequina TaxID=2620311 RepID=UPI001CF284D6|nr:MULTISPECIES: Rv3235 family protein [unclassified Demequina]MCB2413580.1 Rv3235 family protein [Demequina sp. TTPB684]UPU88567.1 Rv3235 family protein [Demequina sp. TMPB413]